MRNLGFYLFLMDRAISAISASALLCLFLGLYFSELDNSLESSWAWVLKFRDEIYLIAFQPGSDGTRLLALKFVEAVILLYTPDPSGSLEPPLYQAFEGKFLEFNISWLHGGHLVLNVRDLSIEASQGLGLLLDQLRFPTVKSLSNSLIIVLINRKYRLVLLKMNFILNLNKIMNEMMNSCRISLNKIMNEMMNSCRISLIAVHMSTYAL